MNIRELREMLGLTVAQASDELNIPRQDLLDCEENGETYLFSRYIAVFPLNPEILTHPQAEPFLPAYVPGTPGSRAASLSQKEAVK